MGPKIIVYTTPLCVPCERLKRILATEDLIFETKDLMVDEVAAELLESKGIRSSPALSIDGVIYVGDDLQPDRLVALLDL